MPKEERTEWKLTKKELDGLRELQMKEAGYRELTNQVALLLSEHHLAMQDWFVKVAKAHQILTKFPNRLKADSTKGTVWSINKFEYIDQLMAEKNRLLSE